MAAANEGSAFRVLARDRKDRGRLGSVRFHRAESDFCVTEGDCWSGRRSRPIAATSEYMLQTRMGGSACISSRTPSPGASPSVAWELGSTMGVSPQPIEIRARPARFASSRYDDHDRLDERRPISDGPDPEASGLSAFTREDLVRICKKRFGKRLQVTSMGRILRELGPSPQTGRPSHPEEDPAAQAAFKKSAGAAQKNYRYT